MLTPFSTVVVVVVEPLSVVTVVETEELVETLQPDKTRSIIKHKTISFFIFLFFYARIVSAFRAQSIQDLCTGLDLVRNELFYCMFPENESFVCAAMPDEGQLQFRHFHSSPAAMASFSPSRLSLRYRPGDAPYFRLKRRMK